MTTFNGITFEVFPFPQSTDFSESLSTKTDILTPKKGVISEQRISIRPVPRQGFAYEVPLKTEKIQARFAALMHGWQKLYFGLPIWHEKEIHTATISAAATTITVDTRYADYRDASLAIIWKSITEYEVVEIGTVEATILNLASPVVSTFTGTKLIMPLRIAQVTDVINISNPVAEYATIQVNFLVKDNVLLTGYVPAETYNGLPVLTLPCILTDGDRKEGQSDSDSFIQDYETGDFNYFSDSQFNINTQSWGFLTESKAELWNFRLFLHSLYGMRGCVWVSTFKKDLVQADTIGAADTSIVVENIKLADNMGLNDLRTHLAFIFPNGTILKREITDITETDANVETINIDSVLGIEVAVDDCYISFLDCCRRASDNVTIEHTVPCDSYSKLTFTSCKEPAPVVIPGNYPTLQIADTEFQVRTEIPTLAHTIALASLADLNGLNPKITPTAVAYYSSSRRKITTAAAHGLTAGDSITFYNTAINGTNYYYSGKTYTVAVVIDSTNFTISATYTTYGTLTGVINWNKALTGNYYQSGDIDMTDAAAVDYNGGAGWIPISGFSGTYDGNSFKITGFSQPITQSRVSNHAMGLFQYNNGTIANVNLENVNLYGEKGGPLCVSSGTGSFYNCLASGTVSFYNLTPTLYQYGNIGGMVGGGGGIWYDCRTSVVVTVENTDLSGNVNKIGGFVGSDTSYPSAVYNNCRAAGHVNCTETSGYASSLVGGFAGETYSAFNDCSASGDVTGGSYVGGFYGAWYVPVG